jgi:predicted dehydrogenase
MARDKLRIAVIGANVNYGWGTRAHLPALKALPAYEVAAVCTTRKETAQETAKHFGVPKAYWDYYEAVNDPTIDVVSVCVRVPRHEQIVLAALRAGKHVFCEWPLGENTVEAAEMLRLAQVKGVRNMIGLQARGSPVLNQMRDLIAGGYVGDVVACTMTSFSPGAGSRNAQGAWALDKTQGVTTLSIAGGHSLDALCFAVGELAEVSSVVSTQVKQATITDTGETKDVTSPDNALVSGRLRNGAVVSAHIASVPAHGSGFRLEVYGTQGTLVASGAGSVQINDLELKGGKKGAAGFAPITIDPKYRRTPEGTPTGAPYNVAQMFQQLAHAITTEAPIASDFALAVKRHELLDAITRSSDTGLRQYVS